MIATGLVIHNFIEFLDGFRVIKLILATIWLVWLPLHIRQLRADARQPFIILTHTAGYGQEDEVQGLIAFPEVTEFTETASALEIRHLPAGGRAHSNPTIPRHQFTSEDWDQLVAILLDRIRAQSPKAAIRTPLHPEG